MKKRDQKNEQLANFGRGLVLIFNRAFMYSASHPCLLETIESVYQTLDQLLQTISPVVFILNREKFYIDEEPLDERANVWKIVTYFKKTGIESLSFYEDIEKSELCQFCGIVTALDKYANAEKMKKAMARKGIRHIKINHVFYKKVTAEDELISRNALKKATPIMLDEANEKAKQNFLKSLFNNVLMEEFAKGLNLQNLLKNPGEVSQRMISADLTTAKRNEQEGQRPGQFLLHQLEAIDQHVKKNLSEERQKDSTNLARALLYMRQELIQGIEAQKALGIAYNDEEQILDKADEITNSVLIMLIKEEYRSGETTIPRLAQILCRLIPDVKELKRLLPLIKSALLEEGMSQGDFMGLIQALRNELQSDALADVLIKNAEQIGIDGEDLIEEIKENPINAAEMIYLASEIRKEGGNEKELSDLLVGYVERMGSQMPRNRPDTKGEDDERHLLGAVNEVKTQLVRHLGNMEIEEDLLTRLEERINQRMDDVLDRLRMEWIKSHSSPSTPEPQREVSVLESLERGVGESEDLKEILKTVRQKVALTEIDENDFSQIYEEIVNQDILRKSEQNNKYLPAGIMRGKAMLAVIDKEIARSKRYGTPFAVLAFTPVKAAAKATPQSGRIRTKDMVDALLYRLAETIRASDIVGELHKNHLVAILPMTNRWDAKSALRRAMRVMNLKPVKINGIPVEIKVAGVVLDIDSADVADANNMADQLSTQITDMARRIKNIHAYSG